MVVGAGYIAVELAGILHTLGSDVSLLIRYEHVSFNNIQDVFFFFRSNAHTHTHTHVYTYTH